MGPRAKRNLAHDEAAGYANYAMSALEQKPTKSEVCYYQQAFHNWHH